MCECVKIGKAQNKGFTPYFMPYLVSFKRCFYSSVSIAAKPAAIALPMAF